MNWKIENLLHPQFARFVLYESHIIIIITGFFNIHFVGHLKTQQTEYFFFLQRIHRKWTITFILHLKIYNKNQLSSVSLSFWNSLFLFCFVLLGSLHSDMCVHISMNFNEFACFMKNHKAACTSTNATSKWAQLFRDFWIGFALVLSGELCVTSLKWNKIFRLAFFFFVHFFS